MKRHYDRTRSGSRIIGQQRNTQRRSSSSYCGGSSPPFRCWLRWFFIINSLLFGTTWWYFFRYYYYYYYYSDDAHSSHEFYNSNAATLTASTSFRHSSSNNNNNTTGQKKEAARGKGTMDTLKNSNQHLRSGHNIKNNNTNNNNTKNTNTIAFKTNKTHESSPSKIGIVLSRSLDKDAVTSDVRGNLGPVSVVIQSQPGTNWIKDRWQAASNMHGTNIPGEHWIHLDFSSASAVFDTRPTETTRNTQQKGRSSVTIERIVLDWETAYADEYILEGALDPLPPITNTKSRNATSKIWTIFDSRTKQQKHGESSSAGSVATSSMATRTITESGFSPGVAAKLPLHYVHDISLEDAPGAQHHTPIRYVRLRILHSATGWGVSLWQFDVYGSRVITPSEDNTGATAAGASVASSFLSPKAYPVYGIELPGLRYHTNTISAVYALPSADDYSYYYGNNPNHTLIEDEEDETDDLYTIRLMNTTTMLSHRNTKQGKAYDQQQQSPHSVIRIKGIAIVLHACTHNAYKFFSPSPQLCPKCIGLSEELQLVRNVLRRGYAVLAITCTNRQSGCWNDQDLARIRYTVEEFQKRYAIVPPTKNRNTRPDAHRGDIPMISIGASSGGSMAAKILAEGIVSSALVMVMSLRSELLDQLLRVPTTTNTTQQHHYGRHRKLYLAPMMKDTRTGKRVRDNYKYITEKRKVQQQQNTPQFALVLDVAIDETSCRPLPVTVEYLWDRVPGMTKEYANIIIDTLIEANHIMNTTTPTDNRLQDPSSSSSSALLIVDPTKSNWRDLLKAKKTKRMNTWNNHNNNNSNNNTDTMVLWGTFDLSPGLSPLAKALHRAWAMHEYCSEAIDPALDFFEN